MSLAPGAGGGTGRRRRSNGAGRAFVQKRGDRGQWTSQKVSTKFPAGVLQVMRGENRPGRAGVMGAKGEMDFKFRSLNSQQIRDAEEYYDSNPFIKAVANLSIQELLGGGIVFPSSSPMGLEQHLSSTWMRFARMLIRSLYVWGIAAVVIEDEDVTGGTPKVLDLGMCNVKVYHTVMNDNQYMFFMDDLSTAIMGDYGQTGQMNPEAMLDRQIEVHAVFELDPPTREGLITSKVMQCMAVGELKHHLDRAEVIASARAANPALVMYRKDPPIKKGTQTFATDNVVPNGLSSVPGISEVSAKDREEMDRVAAYSAWVNSGGTPGLPRTVQGFYQAMDLSRSRHEGASLSHTERVRLPQHHELARQNPATEPKHYMDVVAGYEERVGMIFGVPRSFWAQFSANKATNSQDARLMFSGMQLALKQNILRFLNLTYRMIHGESHIAQLVATAAEHGVEYALKEGKHDLELPGVPPPDVVRQLMLEGVLTFEAYRRYVSTLYGISEESLHKTPQLTLHELNGLEDPNQVAAEGAAEAEAAAAGTVTEEFVTEKTTGGTEGGPSTKTVHKKVVQRGGASGGSKGGARKGAKRPASAASEQVNKRRGIVSSAPSSASK